MFEGWGAAAAAIGAAGAIGGAAISASASSSAASAQTQAAQNANNTQLTMYNQTRADQAPWRGAGGQAVNALSQFYGLGGVNADGTPGTAQGTPDFNSILQNLPGYQFQSQQGNQAVQRNLAAQGLLQSGAAGKALTTFGQGLASNYAQQYTGGLQSLAGLGQSSVQSTGALGGQAANQIGSNQIYAGNAQATGYANQAGAINAGLGGISGAFNQYANYNNPYGYQTPAMNAGAMNAYQGTGGLMYTPGSNGYTNNGYALNVPGYANPN